MASRPDLISRVWTGRTACADADAYAELLCAEILPELAQRLDGFRGGYVLRRGVEDEVESRRMSEWVNPFGERSLAPSGG